MNGDGFGDGQWFDEPGADASKHDKDNYITGDMTTSPHDTPTWNSWLDQGGDPMYLVHVCTNYALIGALIFNFVYPQLFELADIFQDDVNVTTLALITVGFQAAATSSSAVVVIASTMTMGQFYLSTDTLARQNFFKRFLWVDEFLILNIVFVMMSLITVSTITMYQQFGREVSRRRHVTCALVLKIHCCA